MDSRGLIFINEEEEQTQTCIICGRELTLCNFHKSCSNKTGYDYRCKKCKKDIASYKRTEDYFGSYICIKRSECKIKGIPFNLTKEYLKSIWTGICPISGVSLSHNKGSHHSNSAHLDRVDPNGGYTIGNVVWISGRMNRIKYNATIEELEKIVEYMKGNKEWMD